MRPTLYLTLLTTVMAFLLVSPRIWKEREWQRQDQQLRSKLEKMTREADEAVMKRREKL